MLPISIRRIMDTDWKEEADKLHRSIIDDKDWVPYGDVDLRFLTLAMCGEAGELANLIKKDWRGDSINWNDARKELADIRIYLELIAKCLSCNLDRECSDKIEEVKQRYA